MKDLKDQLKSWNSDNPVKKVEAPKPPKKKTREEIEADLSDEELFQRAVDGVQSNAAILQKYDKSDPRPERKTDSKAKKSDKEAALFMQWVEDGDKG